MEIPYIHHGVVSGVFFFLTGEGITKRKTHPFPFRMRHTVPGRISMQRIHQDFADIWDGVDFRGMPLVSSNLIISSYFFFWSNHRLYCLITPIYNCDIYMYFTSISWFHSFFTSSITRVLHSSRLRFSVLPRATPLKIEARSAGQ